jgi:hypothetical protein
MLHLLSALKETLPLFDSILHLGAGPEFQESLYALLPSKKYILVDADPDTAEELRNQIANRPIQVLETLVAPTAGKKTFRCYSLRSWNGLFPLGPIQEVYPRAKLTRTIQIEARSAAEFLDSLQFDPVGKRRALILGVPGLEADLLASCGDRIAQLFDWILLSAAGPLRPDGAKQLADTLLTLEKLHFCMVSQDDQQDQLLHQALFKRDEKSLALAARTKERDTLAAEKQALEARLSTLVSEKDAIAKERELFQKDLAAAKSQVAETEKKRADLEMQRTKERDTLVAEKQALEARLSALDAEKKGLVAGRELLQKDLAAAKSQVTETEKKRADLEMQRTKERDTLVAEKQALEARLSTLVSEKDAIAKERDQLKKTAGDRASRIAELEAQVADQAERQKLIDEQMIRAETQLEMLKEFLKPAF